jgi:hypothetical protein
MNPERFCSPCQWNQKRSPATWVATNKTDGLGLFLCDVCKAGYNIEYTAITIDAFWERLKARRALSVMGIEQPRCQKPFDGATCGGIPVGEPRRCTRCGAYQDNFDTMALRSPEGWRRA